MTARIGDVGISDGFVPWRGGCPRTCAASSGPGRSVLCSWLTARSRQGEKRSLPAAVGSGLPHGSYGGSSAQVPRLF